MIFSIVTRKHVRYNQINIRDRLLCNRFGNQYWLKNVIGNISKYSFFLKYSFFRNFILLNYLINILKLLLHKIFPTFKLLFKLLFNIIKLKTKHAFNKC